MRWGSGKATATLEAPATVEAASPVATSMLLVDEALRMASTRQLFTRAETMSVLHRIEVSTRDLSAGARVVEIVNAADRGSRDQLVVPQADLVNPLLDIRLVLVH